MADSSPRCGPFGQQQNGVPVAPREAALGGFSPGKPLPVPMFVGCRDDRRSIGQAQAEDMFDVMGYPGSVALPPLGENLEGVGHLPVGKLAAGGIDPRFLKNLTACRVDQVFSILATAGDRLPEARLGRSFKKEYVEGRGVNDDQYRDRLFVAGAHASGSVGMPRAGASIRIQKGVFSLRRASTTA